MVNYVQIIDPNVKTRGNQPILRLYAHTLAREKVQVPATSKEGSGSYTHQRERSMLLIVVVSVSSLKLSPFSSSSALTRFFFFVVGASLEPSIVYYFRKSVLSTRFPFCFIDI